MKWSFICCLKIHTCFITPSGTPVKMDPNSAPSGSDTWLLMAFEMVADYFWIFKFHCLAAHICSREKQLANLWISLGLHIQQAK